MNVYFSTWTYMLYHSNIQQPHLSVQVEKWKMSSMSNLILCWLLRCCQPSVHIGRASSMPVTQPVTWARTVWLHSAALGPGTGAVGRNYSQAMQGRMPAYSKMKLVTCCEASRTLDIWIWWKSILNMVCSWNLIIEASVLLSHPPIAQRVHSGYTTWKSLRSERKQCTGLCTPWNIHLRFLMSPHPAQFVSFRFMLWLSEFHFGIVSLILSA